MFESLIVLIKKQPATLEEIAENLPEEVDDLRDVLEGLVVMGKIDRTGKVYHAIGAAPEKRTRSSSAQNSSIAYPDWVETEKEKVNYLLSEEAPLLQWKKAFIWYEDEEPDTGKIVYDSLHTTSKKYEYTLKPNEETKRNEVQFHEVVSGYRGISFKIFEGTYIATWFKASGQKVEREFKSYDDLRTWILQNL